VFGREYSDRTLKDLLALPTLRSAIVLAKFVVVASWSAALTVVILTAVAGLAGTIIWWELADQTH
jgi:ABC-2 type transport system permease protein